MDFTLLFGVLKAGLDLWTSEEKTKYIDKIFKLKKAWYEEYNKPITIRSDVALDDIKLELRLLTESFIEASQSKNAKIQ